VGVPGMACAAVLAACCAPSELGRRGTGPGPGVSVSPPSRGFLISLSHFPNLPRVDCPSVSDPPDRALLETINTKEYRHETQTEADPSRGRDGRHRRLAGRCGTCGRSVERYRCEWENDRGRIAGTDARTSSASLTAIEQEQVLFMREEEKFARDVYTFLYEKWGVKEFQAIAASESRHMSRVKILIARYRLDDPVATDVPGVFVSDALQAAYDSLVAQGSVSEQEAYKVGVAVEELDIADLQEALESTTKRDVARVIPEPSTWRAEPSCGLHEAAGAIDQN